MIQLHNSIRDRIQGELNKNTQGLNFEVSLYNVKTNDLLENTEKVSNTYATKQKRFIPVLIENISGEYSDLQNLTAAEASINASFLIPTDSQDFNNMIIDETFDKVSIALDEFRERTLANNLPLGNTSYLLPKEYKLKALNKTTPFNVEFNEIFVRFNDESTGNILSDESGFRIVKEEGKIEFYLEDNKIYEYNVVINNEYQIYFYDIGNNQVQISVFDGSNTTTEIIENVTYDIEGLILGGVFMEIRRWNMGTLNSGILNSILRIEDFSSLIPAIGSSSLIDTTNANFSILKGSLGTIVLGFSIPNPTTNQFTFGNGLNYQQFELDMTAFITDSVFIGNDVKYFLNEVRIFPVFRDEPFVSETDASQVVGQQMTRHTAVQSVLSREYSLFFKQQDNLIDLAKKITSLTPNPNEVFTLRVEYPLFERQYEVIVTQGALGITNNSPISISIKLDLASTSIQ